jgi:hypothetical protein
LFNFSTFQPFNRAAGARAARFPLHHDAPSARRELETGTPQNQRLPMNPAKPKNLVQKGATPQSVDILKEIQEWFQNQCDGEWEHARRITLESCDNPGWWLKIDLQGTNLENKKFKEIKTGDFSLNMPEPPWIHLYVENGVFNGAGDAMQLENILRYFLDWSQE